MFHLDNTSGVPEMPEPKEQQSITTKWFGESVEQGGISWPGADWFNVVQAELLNLLAAAGIEPDKHSYDQLSKAIPTLGDAKLRKDLGAATSRIIALPKRGYLEDALKWVTPEMYGATGDGRTDDTDALEAMFADVEESGQMGIRLAGNYLFSRPLQCHYIQKSNFGVSVEGVFPWSGFIWNGASGQNALNLCLSFHGYRLKASCFRITNNTGISDTFTAVRFSGQEQEISYLHMLKDQWRCCYWGVIQHLSVIQHINIENDTRVANNAAIDPVGIGIRMNSCLNTTVAHCRISYTDRAWETGFMEDGQAIADILPDSYSGTVGYGCEGISFIDCKGTSNYNGASLRGVSMSMHQCMLDITKYKWLTVYGQAITVTSSYFGVVSSYDYGNNSRLIVDSSGVYGLTMLHNEFMGSVNYQSKLFIPAEAHYVQFSHNYLSYHLTAIRTRTGNNRAFGNIYDTNTSAVTQTADSVFGIGDFVDFMTYIRMGGQLYVGRNANDPGGKLVIQPEGTSTQRGLIVTQAGVRALSTALGNAAINAAPTSNDAILNVGSVAGNGRSLTAAGTLNASGADYAEYFFKSEGCGEIEPGEIAGVNSDGMLTKKFSESVAFLVKSTNPSYVGGDTWRDNLPERPMFDVNPAVISTINEDDPSTYTDEFREYKDALSRWEALLETARESVDRMAICGQVPVNVTGGTPGSYLIPVAGPNDAIEGFYVEEGDIDFIQYRKALGKVICIRNNVSILIVGNK